MVSLKDLGGSEFHSIRKKIMARLAAILAILLFFSARGPKINNIEKKSLMKKHNFWDFLFMLNIFSDVQISDFL